MKTECPCHVYVFKLCNYMGKCLHVLQVQQQQQLVKGCMCAKHELEKQLLAKY